MITTKFFEGIKMKCDDRDIALFFFHKNYRSSAQRSLKLKQHTTINALHQRIKKRERQKQKLSKEENLSYHIF